MSARKSEHGFTLIELVVASMLLILVLAGVGGAILSSLRAERVVRTTTAAATSAQFAASAVARGVRNAHALDVVQPSPGAWLIRALIVDDLSGPTAHCEAWYLGGGDIRATRSDTAVPVPTGTAAPADWDLLATGVTPADGRPMVALSGSSAELVFLVAERDGPPTLVETTAVSRQVDPSSGRVTPLPAPLEEDQCF